MNAAGSCGYSATISYVYRSGKRRWWSPAARDVPDASSSAAEHSLTEDDTTASGSTRASARADARGEDARLRAREPRRGRGPITSSSGLISTALVCALFAETTSFAREDAREPRAAQISQTRSIVVVAAAAAIRGCAVVATERTGGAHDGASSRRGRAAVGVGRLRRGRPRHKARRPNERRSPTPALHHDVVRVHARGGRPLVAEQRRCGR